MAKRPRFSRWRRLPGVFRTGDHRPTDSGTDLDRIILYVPARILDLAEALAEKAGVATVQDYCALLLMRAIENERIDQKVADIEARRGPLEGLKQIADDPDYLAEWQERSDTKSEASHEGRANHETTSKSVSANSDTITVDIVYPDDEAMPVKFALESLPGPLEEQGTNDEPRSNAGGSEGGVVPIVYRKSTVLKMSDSSAVDVISRHTGSTEDHWGLLPSLRRGEPIPAAKSAEILYALNQLEEELKGAAAIDRRLAHSLHRLALESQVLLTDAWPGVFDERVISVIRTVQESVERILSGQDVRYYPQTQGPGSERQD